ncbi:MAG: hypothetical protein LQ352_006405, partial [Teloschistes flavicans]
IDSTQHPERQQIKREPSPAIQHADMENLEDQPDDSLAPAAAPATQTPTTNPPKKRTKGYRKDLSVMYRERKAEKRERIDEDPELYGAEQARLLAASKRRMGSNGQRIVEEGHR